MQVGARMPPDVLGRERLSWWRSQWPTDLRLPRDRERRVASTTRMGIAKFSKLCAELSRHASLGVWRCVNLKLRSLRYKWRRKTKRRRYAAARCHRLQTRARGVLDTLRISWGKRGKGHRTYLYSLAYDAFGRWLKDEGHKPQDYPKTKTNVWESH